MSWKIEYIKEALRDLKKLDAGSWKDPKYAGEPLPTLAETLDFARKRIGVYIEIKNSDNDAELEQAILNYARELPTLSQEDAVETLKLIAKSGSRNYELTNKVIALVETMKENFITVYPAGNKKGAITAASLAGIRDTLDWLRKGHPVGFFPSGAVSDLQLPSFRIRDRKWQRSIVNLIRSAQVPVLPLHFFDGNSPLYYFLGLVHPRVRLMRMPHEVFNKRHQSPRLAVGEWIPPERLAGFNRVEHVEAYLRQAVYEMPLPREWTPRTLLSLHTLFPDRRRSGPETPAHWGT